MDTSIANVPATRTAVLLLPPGRAARLQVMAVWSRASVSKMRSRGLAHALYGPPLPPVAAMDSIMVVKAKVEALRAPGVAHQAHGADALTAAVRLGCSTL